MHATIPYNYIEDLETVIVEGNVYKIQFFQVITKKASHNAVPGNFILCSLQQLNLSRYTMTLKGFQGIISTLQHLMKFREDQRQPIT